MSFTTPRTHLRVQINGVVVRTSSEIAISESLDQMSRTAEFLLAAQPDPQPAEGDTVLIELLDDDASLGYALFGGTINSLDVESEPWAYSALCCDQLELFRATKKGGDLNLSGLTDGEAWMAIADYCGVVYNPLHISDTGYVLGAHQALAWHDDASTSGSSVIAELDSVFGMATMTVQDNIPIRIPVDFTPSDDGSLYRTYTKGVDADWGAHHRSRGDRASIQNVWRVTGAGIESSDHGCTATPWAFAVAGNAQIGRRVRTSEQSFSSDFIQDESLAEYIVRREMQRSNRPPDRATLALSIEANLHPGRKITLVDHTYGINTGAGRRCLVTGVSRSGLTMSADCVCGGPGDDGTVTTGVDKVCGDDHVDTPIDDGFVPAPLDFPPIDLGDAIDISDLFDAPGIDGTGFSWSMGTPEEECVPPTTPSGCVTTAWSSGISIAPATDWEITGTLTLNDDGDALTLGLDTDDGFYRFRIAGGAYYDPLVGQFKYELLAPSLAHRLPGYAPIGSAVSWRLLWETALSRLTFYAEFDDLCYADVIVELGATMATAVTWESVSGTPTRASESIKHSCVDIGPDPPPGIVWTEDTALGGSWDLIADAHFTGASAGGVSPSPQGIAFIDPIISGDLPDFVVVGYFKLGTERWEVDVIIGSDMGGFALEFDFEGNDRRTVSPHRALTLVGFGSDDGEYVDQGVPSFVAGDRVDWTLTVNPSADTVALELAQGGSTWTLTHIDTDWYTEAGDSSASITAQITGKNNATVGESVVSLQSVDFL